MPDPQTPHSSINLNVDIDPLIAFLRVPVQGPGQFKGAHRRHQIVIHDLAGMRRKRAFE